MSEFNLPTEMVELPSKGLAYPEGHPLREGKVEVKYMTAKEEDILTNQSYIEKGTVLDKLLESVVVSKINIKDLIIGDKNALLIATRILGYGKDYSFSYMGESYDVDLSTLENKEIDESLLSEGNKFFYTLPNSNIDITFKILDGHDETKIEKEIQGLKKINKNASPELSTRLKYIITSINGDSESRTIRNFVENNFLARDSRSLRNHIKEVQPDVDLTYITDSNEEITIPIGISFFWPDY
tara:strand:- start:2900 stop:3622 length:723 start_codon:yes stop_codon:yes gene_type:complete